MGKIHLLSRPPSFEKAQSSAPEDENLLASDNFDQGLITDIDIGRIPPNGLSTATNVSYSKGLVLRRNGTTIYPITKPDANKIMGIYGFYHEGTGIAILRASRNSLYRAGSAGWTAIAASGIAAFSGSDSDFFNFTAGDNRCFASNNGIDPIREIDLTLYTYKALGNAPRCRYLTAAFNRIIGANLYVPAGISNPVEIDWSGDRNYGVWDIATDPSAGSTSLVDSPSDTNDDITNLFSTANLLIVPRLKSIWIGIGQPSATAPFRFFSALAKLGADIPRAIDLTDYGLVWFNYQNAAAYAWIPGQGNQPAEKLEFSSKVRRAIKADITDPNYITGSYSSDTRTFSIIISNPNTSAVIFWDFNFVEKKWSRGEYASVCEVDDLDFASSTVSIDELTGTIDALAGTIDSLGGIVSLTTRFLGFTNGELHTQKAYHGYPTSPAVDIKTDDNGTAFTTTIGYKLIEAPVDYLFSNIIRCALTPYSVGTVTLQSSKDDGLTWTTQKTKTFVSGDLNKQFYLQLKKSIRFKRIIWRITTSDCMCANNGFYVKALRAGEAQ